MIRARGRHAQVAAGHVETAEAAAAVLTAGGNAFDAAVAAGFASAACEPTMTSLGGGGFLLARTARGEPVVFDFFVDTPGLDRSSPPSALDFLPFLVRFGGSEQSFNVGLGAVAVPGCLKGYLHVHRRLGRLPLGQVVAPAIDLAREGVVVSSHQAYVMGLLKPVLAMGEAGRTIYSPAGTTLREGERMVNRDLAEFLSALDDGAEESFYSGEVARRIERDMREGGGLVGAVDLAAYRVVERAPLSLRYRNHVILTNPPPSVGGSLIAESFRLLEERGPSEKSWLSANHVRGVVSVMVEVDRRRSELRDAGAASTPRFSRGTTHVSVADSEGNVASLTTTNGEGSGYIVPGTGIMLNNMMGEDDLHPSGFHQGPAGVRVGSMMAPSLLLRDGAVEIVAGSGGSKRIRTALFQVIGHVADFGVGVGEAIEAPRVHWDGEIVQLEPGFSADVVEALRRIWPVNVWAESNLYFGGVNAVAPRGGAAADPRRGGCARIVST